MRASGSTRYHPESWNSETGELVPILAIFYSKLSASHPITVGSIDREYIKQGPALLETSGLQDSKHLL